MEGEREGEKARAIARARARGEGATSTSSASSPDESDQEGTLFPYDVSLNNIFQRYHSPIIVYTPRSTALHSGRQSLTPPPPPSSIRYPSLSRTRERRFQDEGHDNEALPSAAMMQSLHLQATRYDGRGGDGRASMPASPSAITSSTSRP